jgi:MYXO-CTERM domain-containing protein
VLDTDGDGIPDDVDPDPVHPNATDAGTPATTDGGAAGTGRVTGCGCQAGLADDAWLAAVAVPGLGALRRRRTKQGF